MHLIAGFVTHARDAPTMSLRDGIKVPGGAIAQVEYQQRVGPQPADQIGGQYLVIRGGRIRPSEVGWQVGNQVHSDNQMASQRGLRTLA